MISFVLSNTLFCMFLQLCIHAPVTMVDVRTSALPKGMELQDVHAPSTLCFCRIS